MNSSLVRDQVAKARARLHTLSNDELASQLYLGAFSRLPRTSERAVIMRHFESANDRAPSDQEHSDRDQAIEDVVWALINTNEFMFQH